MLQSNIGDETINSLCIFKTKYDSHSVINFRHISWLITSYYLILFDFLYTQRKDSSVFLGVT